jgi:hypothetical protein
VQPPRHNETSGNLSRRSLHSKCWNSAFQVLARCIPGAGMVHSKCWRGAFQTLERHLPSLERWMYYSVMIHCRGAAQRRRGISGHDSEITRTLWALGMTSPGVLFQMQSPYPRESAYLTKPTDVVKYHCKRSHYTLQGATIMKNHCLVNVCKSPPNPKKLLIAQIRHKKACAILLCPFTIFLSSFLFFINDSSFAIDFALNA